MEHKDFEFEVPEGYRQVYHIDAADKKTGLKLTLGAMAILIVVIVGCVLVSRFFCKVMCPLGAMYGMLNKVSLYRMDVDRAKCISCGSCSKVCPMDVEPHKVPNSAECKRCGHCITACPKEALSAGFKLNTKESNTTDLKGA
jgi:polyferredoxin